MVKTPGKAQGVHADIKALTGIASDHEETKPNSSASQNEVTHLAPFQDHLPLLLRPFAYPSGYTQSLNS